MYVHVLPLFGSVGAPRSPAGARHRSRTVPTFQLHVMTTVKPANPAWAGHKASVSTKYKRSCRLRAQRHGNPHSKEGAQGEHTTLTRERESVWSRVKAQKESKTACSKKERNGKSSSKPAQHKVYMPCQISRVWVGSSHGRTPRRLLGSGRVRMCCVLLELKADRCPRHTARAS